MQRLLHALAGFVSLHALEVTHSEMARDSGAASMLCVLLQHAARSVTKFTAALLLLLLVPPLPNADATGSTELLSQQLPLDPLGCAAVQLSSKGLQATGAPFDAAGSSTALTALEQQQPATAQQGQQLKAALLQVGCAWGAAEQGCWEGAVADGGVDCW